MHALVVTYGLRDTASAELFELHEQLDPALTAVPGLEVTASAASAALVLAAAPVAENDTSRFRDAAAEVLSVL